MTTQANPPVITQELINNAPYQKGGTLMGYAVINDECFGYIVKVGPETIIFAALSIDATKTNWAYRYRQHAHMPIYEADYLNFRKATKEDFSRFKISDKGHDLIVWFN